MASCSQIPADMLFQLVPTSMLDDFPVRLDEAHVDGGILSAHMHMAPRSSLPRLLLEGVLWDGLDWHTLPVGSCSCCHGNNRLQGWGSLTGDREYCSRRQVLEREEREGVIVSHLI